MDHQKINSDYESTSEPAPSSASKEEEGEDDNQLRHEVILYGKRVDVTNFIHRHPGGSKVLRIFKNRDATEQFEAYHSVDCARKWLKTLPQRDILLKSNDFLPSETPIAKDFASLVQTMKKQGFYKADPIEEIVKLALIVVPYVIGHYFLLSSNINETRLSMAILLIGWSLYYSGWVSHDYLHHSVIRGGPYRDETTSAVVPWNNAMGYVLGVLQGYEVDWWRARHNTHHVVTNEDGNDPDIKTAPVLVYVRNNRAIAISLNSIQQFQQYYYLPVMCILDMYWRFESLVFVLIRLPKYWKQLISLALHYVWTCYTFYGNYRYLLYMSLFRGFLTGTVVFSTHYGEDLLKANPKLTLVEQTSLTSRNITGGYITNLLTGFLSLQTEHHLFPTMPTSSLAKARPYVIKFFKKHGLEYREGTIIDCIQMNIRALKYDYEPSAAMSTTKKVD